VIAAPLWLVGAGKAVWTFLKSVPWWVFAGAAALIVGWWQVSAYGERQYEAGRIACQTEWDAQRARDDAEAVRRQREADSAALKAAQDGAAAVTTTREETHAATERVRVEWRERVVRVPAECRAAVELPDGVQAEGRAAVERARGALRPTPDG
jgi:hypothetical protein